MDVPPVYPEKVCTKCGRTLPLDEFYVKIKATGRRFSWCKACHYAMTVQNAAIRKSPQLQAERDERRRLAELEPKPTVRICKACGLEKPVTDFRHYRRTCRECERLAFEEYRHQYPERVAATQARNEARPERRAYLSSYWKEHRAETAKRGREARLAKPELYRTAVKRYRTTHPDANRISLANRRARLARAPGRWTAWEWERLKAQYNWTCLACGRREPEIALHFDHVVPLSLGGWNIISNGQPLCAQCNGHKHTKVVDFRPNFYRL